LALFVCLAGFVTVMPLQAQVDKDWKGASTDWNNAANWTTAVPGALDSAWINGVTSGNYPQIVTNEGAGITNLYIGRGDHGTMSAGNLTIGPGGKLIVQNEIHLGVYGDPAKPNSWSTLNLAGGTLTKATANGNFHIGWDGGDAQFLMTGNSLYNQADAYVYVGGYGSGTQGLFSMTDNAVANLSADMRIGDNEWGNAGACSGSLTMSGNSLITRSGSAYVIFGQGNQSTTSDTSGYFSMKNNAQFLAGTGSGGSVGLNYAQYQTGIGWDGGHATMVMYDNTYCEAGFNMLVGQTGGVGSLTVGLDSTTGLATAGGTISVGQNSHWEFWAEQSLNIGRWGGTGTALFTGHSALNVWGPTHIGDEASGGVGSDLSNGALTLAGSATMTTYGGQTSNGLGWGWGSAGDVYVGCSTWETGYAYDGHTQSLSGGLGSLIVKDYATLNNSNGTFFIGTQGGTGTVLFTDHATIYSAGGLNVGIGLSGTKSGAINTPLVSVGVVDISGYATVTTPAAIAIGNGGGAGTLTVRDNAVMTTATDLNVGGSGSGVAVANLSGSSTSTVGGNLTVGAYGDVGGVSTLSVNGNAQLTVNANLRVSYKWNSNPAQFGTNTANVNGGTVIVKGSLIVGCDGGSGVFNQEGGLTATANPAIVGDFDLSDGPGGTPGVGVLNLDGGTFQTPALTTQSNAAYVLGTAGTINFNGGVLKATADNPAFIAADSAAASMALNVKTGGAIFDTNGCNVGIRLPLTHFGSPATTDGGLTKLGAGTLSFSSPVNNNYNGRTTVKDGVLLFSGTAAWNPILALGGGDVQGGKIVFDYSAAGSAADPMTTVLSALASAKIDSSTVLANPSYGIGYDDNNATGHGVASGVMLEIALLGDTNLDGSITTADVTTILSDYGKTNQTWAQGDLDYDGIITVADLKGLLANYVKVMPPNYSVDLAQFPNLDGAAVGALRSAGITIIPEPGALALLAAGLTGLLAYAWRKRA
jgi:autotransporter-associated beta strand protein